MSEPNYNAKNMPGQFDCAIYWVQMRTYQQSNCYAFLTFNASWSEYAHINKNFHTLLSSSCEPLVRFTRTGYFSILHKLL